MIAAGVILVAFLGLYLWTSKAPKDIPKATLSPITSTTEVSTAPKTSPADNDVEITQTYKANVNGVQVTAPVKTSSASSSGTKGIIKQEIDLAPIVDLAKESAKKDYYKEWSIGTGYGVHKGSAYIPLEIEKTYSHSPKVDKAVSIEAHFEPSLSNLKVNGGELKHKWRF
jgi:hypothetical protein